MSYYTNKIDAKIADLLKNGEAGFLPTDTIYGLSSLALSRRAVEKIHKLKRRDGGKPLVVLISDLLQLEQLGLQQEQANLAKKYWPGCLSVILESNKIPSWLERSTKSLAVRLPDNKALKNLIDKVGPIVSTSANWQGMKPASSTREAKKYFGEDLDFYVDIGELHGQPSTLAKLEGNKLKVIRAGAIDI